MYQIKYTQNISRTWHGSRCERHPPLAFHHVYNVPRCILLLLNILKRTRQVAQVTMRAAPTGGLVLSIMQKIYISLTKISLRTFSKKYLKGGHSLVPPVMNRSKSCHLDREILSLPLHMSESFVKFAVSEVDFKLQGPNLASMSSAL